MCSLILLSLVIEFNKMKASMLTILLTFIGLSTCVIIQPAANTKVLTDNYIVQLEPEVDLPYFLDNTQLQGTPLADLVTNIHVNFCSFSAKLNKEQLESLDGCCEVRCIEYDQMMHTCYVSQLGAPWGLVRISKRDTITPTTTSYRYVKPDGAAPSVKVYVIDSGILLSHPEFQGRAKFGKTFVPNESNSDENGHGTHVAGIIASKTYGVSKDATVVSVKVFDKNTQGTNSNIIAGIDYAITNCAGGPRCVINMSLGGGHSQMLNDAVSKAVDSGISVCVAAGNSGGQVMSYSPASALKAITVAASDINDNYAPFSNFGAGTDIIGPGVNILSTWLGNGTNTLSGTSMASPHIAGLVAYFIRIYNITSIEAANKVIEFSTPNKITANGQPLKPSTPNRIAYNNVA